MTDKSTVLNPNANVFVPRATAATFVPGVPFHQVPAVPPDPTPPVETQSIFKDFKKF